MATTKALIESAMRSIGVLAGGEEAKPAELQDALTYCKQMLDGWSNETLMVPAYVHETFTLTAKSKYMIGPGSADFDTVRPTLIENLRIKNAGGLEIPVRIITVDAYADLRYKDSQTTYPRWAYYEPTRPEGTLYLSASTIAGDELIMISSKPIEDLPALTADITYPPGYERAIRLNLAMELAPEYGKPLDQVIAAQARQAITVLKRTNSATKGRTAKVDAGLLSRGGHGYDIYSGPE